MKLSCLQMEQAYVAVYRTQEHCTRIIYAGSILATDFIAVEKTWREWRFHLCVHQSYEQ